MNTPQAIVVGCSAGGVDALKTLLGGLDKRVSQKIMVCCHSGSDTITLLCELLARVCPLPVIEATERQPVLPGTVHLAPSGYHLLVEANQHFALSVDPRVNYSRPSIDVLFDSAAPVWRQRLIGIVLTGGNADGAAGLRHIRQRGGLAIVQSPATAEMPVMPQAAFDLAGADHCIDLGNIAPLLNQLCLA